MADMRLWPNLRPGHHRKRPEDRYSLTLRVCLSPRCYRRAKHEAERCDLLFGVWARQVIELALGLRERIGRGEK